MNRIVKLALELSRATEWEVIHNLETHRSTLLVYGLTSKEIDKLQQLVDLVVPAPHRYGVLDMHKEKTND